MVLVMTWTITVPSIEINPNWFGTNVCSYSESLQVLNWHGWRTCQRMCSHRLGKSRTALVMDQHEASKAANLVKLREGGKLSWRYAVTPHLRFFEISNVTCVRCELPATNNVYSSLGAFASSRLRVLSLFD